MNRVRPSREAVLAARARGYQAAAQVTYAAAGPLVVELRAAGLSFQAIGDALTEQGILPPAGGMWWPAAVRRVYRKFADMT